MSRHAKPLAHSSSDWQGDPQNSPAVPKSTHAAPMMPRAAHCVDAEHGLHCRPQRGTQMLTRSPPGPVTIRHEKPFGQLSTHQAEHC
jgi:hypothetical protein